MGHGTVGRSVRRIILQHHDRLCEVIRQRTHQNVTLEIIGVLVKDRKKHPVLGESAYTQADSLVAQKYDVLIELLGGLAPASELIKQALLDGKDVVTANKHALFASQGELEDMARRSDVSLSYEAAVAGAVPILRSIRSLVSGQINRIEGILNGSTNYILTQVAGGISLADALKDASERGFLEADPSSDVDGFDAMYKLGILIYLATGRYPSEDDIERIGITNLSEEMINQAKVRNRKYKLIATADFINNRFSVKPEAITSDHYLYQVDGALNGITLLHEHAGELSFQGTGAGGDETASAVIGDLIDTICHRLIRRQRD